MHVSDLRRDDINFLIELLKKEKLTRRDQTSYRNSQRFYIGTWFLKDAGLIKLKGIDDRRQNIYVLTQKGKEIAELLLKLEKLLGGM